MLPKKYLLINLLGLIGLALIFTSPLYAEENQDNWTKIFNAERTRFHHTGSNPYFKLEPGYYLILDGQDGENRIKLIVAVLFETKMIDGVETRVVEEKEFHNGMLAEISRNFFAIDTVTNSIYYFGEEVDIYKDGKVVNHEGAWESGVDGAHFGLMMPGVVLLGAKYYQETAPDVAMDRAEIISMTETVETPLENFSNSLKVEETTPLEPEAKEYKYFHAGVGLVKDGPLDLTEKGTVKDSRR